MIAAASIPLIQRALDCREALAIQDPQGRWTYGQAAEAAAGVARRLLQDRTDLDSARVAFMAPPGFSYVAIQWGIWLAGGIAVPLCLSHPARELEYALREAQVDTALGFAEFEERLRPAAESVGARFLRASDADWASSPSAGPAVSLPSVSGERPAMILFTSGTTSRPKGVVLTHSNIEAQIRTLVQAWEWTSQDRILNVLPLHHTHGIVNVLCSALWSGAVCEALPQFDASQVWDRFLSGEVTLFMAVPTIYVKLIRAWDGAAPDAQKAMSQAVSRLRLTVSGSAALPVSVFDKWKEISGQPLLERYGMTEIGMALSNPLHGPRRPGFVGAPLPGVEVRLVGEDGKPAAEGEPGEIQVRGPNVFREYWNRPEATAQAFVEGWFRTGDVAQIEQGSYRILGRSSVDIIKTGGFKVSALEIEEVLRAHPAVLECAVVGVADPEWGERVCAAAVLRQGCSLALEDLRSWARERIAPYKLPSRLLPVEELPRNAMGKVTKPKVAELFQ